MSNSPRISIIVPVYNTGKYVEKCLNSLINQTYSNLEIICVDDGSKDNSVEIISEIQKTDSRIILYQNEHSGASVARNLGIEKSTGEYLSFIDSDDWVFLTLYKTFVNYLEKYKQISLNTTKLPLDIYMFNASAYVEGQNDVIPKTFFDFADWNNHKNKYTIHTFDDCMRPFSRNLSAANKIYRKGFLIENNIKFPENLKYEDQYFGLKTFLRAKSILINDEIFYRYRNMNDTSSTLEVTPKVFDIFKIVDLVEDEIYKLHKYESVKYALFQYKFNSYITHYKYCPKDLCKKYFEEMKVRLLDAEKRNLNPQIYSRLRNYNLFEKVKNSTFEEFDNYIL